MKMVNISTGGNGKSQISDNQQLPKKKRKKSMHQSQSPFTRLGIQLVGKH